MSVAAGALGEVDEPGVGDAAVDPAPDPAGRPLANDACASGWSAPI
jgi:hypothetical protein